MRRGLGVFPHAHGFEGPVHASADVPGRYAEVFKAKGAVLLHHGGDDLVVRVLEDHAASFAHFEAVFFLVRGDAVNPDLALLRDVEGVEQLGKRRFAAAVAAQHGHELAALHAQAHAGDGFFLRALVAKLYIFYFNDGVSHGAAPPFTGGIIPPKR